MARYEKAGTSEFWDVKLEGKQVVVYSGNIGMQGKGTATDFPTPAEAKAERDKLVAQKQKKGFVPVRDLPETAKYARFEKAGDGVTEVIEAEVSDRGFASWFGKGSTGRGVKPFPTVEIARRTPEEALKAYEEDAARWRADGYTLVAENDHVPRTQPPPPKAKPAKAKKA